MSKMWQAWTNGILGVWFFYNTYGCKKSLQGKMAARILLEDMEVHMPPKSLGPY